MKSSKTAGAPSGMMKIIIFSDLHIESDGESRPDSSLMRLHAAVDEVCSCHADAEAVVVAGDIVHRGDTASYRLARRELSRLTMPFYLIPGNHDNRDTMREVFPAQPAGFMQRVFSTSAGDFVLIDSVREGEVGGGYCPERAEWLRQTLRRARRPVFVCMHHPPLQLPYLQDSDFNARHFQHLEEVVAEYPDSFRYFIFGHVHAAAGGVWQGVPFSVMRSFWHQTYLTERMPDGGMSYIPTNAAPHYGILLVDENRVILNHHGFLENIPVS